MGESLTNNAQIYASPDGDDSNSGSDFQHPKKTLYAAAATLASQGGGELHFAHGCDVGGPIDGQGLWLRGDGLDSLIAGWLPAFPLRLIGHGKVTYRGFQPPDIATFYGGVNSDGFGDRTRPALWVCGANFPLTFENMQPAGHNPGEHHDDPAYDITEFGVCYRIGWDYNRNYDDWSIQRLAITSAVRVGQLSTFTVTLPAALSLSSASRGTVAGVANTVTLKIDKATNSKFPPWRVGQVVHIVTSDPDFPSADMPIVAQNDFNFDPDTTHWTIQYVQAGATLADQPLSGTIQSHACGASFEGGYVELVSTNAHWVSTVYRVVAHTYDTISVVDIFGDGDQTASDIGTVAHQERTYLGTTQIVLDSLSGALFATDPPSPSVGPMYDVGHNAAMPTVIRNCWIQGLEAGDNPRDDDRMAGIFGYPGAFGALGITCVNNKSTGGGLRAVVPATGTGQIIMRGHVGEGLGSAPPSLDVVGNSFTAVYGEFVFNADNSPSVPNVRVRGCAPTSVILSHCGNVDAEGIAGDWWDTPGQWLASGVKSPWARNQAATYADLRITGKHPGSNRAMGVVAARIQNLIAPDSSWTGTPTLTGGVDAPDGSSTAVRLSSVGAGQKQIIPIRGIGPVWAVGGRMVVAGWIRVSGGPSGIVFSIATTDDPTSPTDHPALRWLRGGAMVSPFGGSGWQWMSFFDVLTEIDSDSPNFEVSLGCPDGDIDVWGLTAFYVPPDGATNGLDDNDFGEMFGTLKHQPLYLPPGMAGTMEHQKLIAHGGVGYSSDVVTVTTSVLNAPTRQVDVFNEGGKLLGRMQLGFTIPTASLVGWWKADALSGSDGDPVGSVPDSSGSGHAATQASAGKKPVLKTGANGLGGLPVIRFDGSNDTLTASIDPGSAGMTLFWVARRVSSTGDAGCAVVSGTDGSTEQMSLTLRDQTADYGIGATGPSGDGSTFPVHLGGTPPGVVVTGKAFFQRYRTDKTKWTLDGLVINPTGVSDSAFPGSPFSMWLGSNQDTIGYFDGDIAEVLVYTSPLSDDDCDLIQAYLTAKWSLS